MSAPRNTRGHSLNIDANGQLPNRSTSLRWIEEAAVRMGQAEKPPSQHRPPEQRKDPNYRSRLCSRCSRPHPERPRTPSPPEYRLPQRSRPTPLPPVPHLHHCTVQGGTLQTFIHRNLLSHAKTHPLHHASAPPAMLLYGVRSLWILCLVYQGSMISEMSSRVRFSFCSRRSSASV